MLRALLILLLFGGVALAQGVSGFPPGTFQSRAHLDAAGGSPPAYVGPGDLSLSSTFVAWYGYRCFSSSYSGNVASIWDAATHTTLNTVITCSGGVMDTSSPDDLATTCATACEVDILYDQAGTHCDGSVACNVEASAPSARPVFDPAGSPDGTKGCHLTNDATTKLDNSDASGAPTLTQAIPFAASSVYKQTTVGTGVQNYLGTASSVRVGFENTAAPNNQHVIYNGSSFPGAVASNNAFHAFNDTFATSSSSIVSIDGTSTTGLTLGGSNDFSSGDVVIGHDGIGVFCEGGILNGALSTGDNSTLSANQHDATNGWNF